MPLNLEVKSSKFEVIAEQSGMYGFGMREVFWDTITVKRGETEMIPIGPDIDGNHLIISSNSETDPGYRAEINYIPTDGGVDQLLYEAKFKIEKHNNFESASNINFASLRVVTELEVPLLAGSLKVKIRRLT